MNEIILRQIVETDLPLFFEHQVDPEAIRIAAFPARGREAFMAHWAKILADPAVVTRAIVFEGEVAGNVVAFEQKGVTLVGYWIGREYWGRGIATSALSQFLPFVTTRPLYAHVAKHNLASIRVLEKCGFLPERSQVGSDGIEELILTLG